MKKIMLCAAVIVAAMAMTGCKKVCNCTVTAKYGGITATESTEIDLRNQSVYKSCSDYAKAVNDAYKAEGISEYTSVSCK